MPWMTPAVVAYMSLAAAAVSAGATYMQAEATKEQQDAYNKNLEKEAIRQYQELDKVEADAIYESHAQSMEAQREYMEARSQVELQAAVTGTYGNSVNLALQDLNTGLGGRMAEITYNRESQLDEINRTAEGIKAGTTSAADMTIHPPAYYSAFSAGLGTYQTVSTIGTGIGTAGKEAGRAVPKKKTSGPKWT